MMVATPAGLSFVDGAGVRSLYAFHGLVNNHVYTLATAGSRTLAGTLGGISSVENDTVRVNYDASNSGLRHNWITAIVASGGDWFAGTYGAGVFRMQSRPGSGADNGRWQALNSAKDGFIVNPNAMLVVGDRVYAGTLGRGLLVFDRVSGRWISANEGLPSANVTALVEARGYVYAGTDNGLVRFSADAF
jgi:ligand-binding sensor domain-containing protein